MSEPPTDPWHWAGVNPPQQPKESPMRRIAPYWKAAVGFIAPAAVVLTSAVTEASAGGEHITTGEWVTAGCAAFITAAAVYGKSNRQ